MINHLQSEEFQMITFNLRKFLPLFQIKIPQMYGLYTNWRFLFDFLHSEEDSVFNSTLNSSDCRICMKKDLIQEGHLLTLCF